MERIAQEKAEAEEKERERVAAIEKAKKEAEEAARIAAEKKRQQEEMLA